MAARVTQAEVEAIILDIDPQLTDLTSFITTANVLVTAVCTDDVLTTDLLKQIELYLAAHFTCITDPMVAKDLAGEPETKIDLNLHLTRYGQMAVVLDISGALAALEDMVEAPGAVRRPLIRSVVYPNASSL